MASQNDPLPTRAPILQPHEALSGDIYLLQDIRAQFGDEHIPKQFPKIADAIKYLRYVADDRQYLLEKVVVGLAQLPKDSIFFKIAHNLFINLIYKDLPHPPTGFLSTFRNAPSTTAKEQTVSYAFRSADGSNYNVFSPSLGQAGQPYPRSVPSTHIQTLPLPDPGLVFDRLLSRGDNKFAAHPGGLSSLFFAFADLIVHTLFRTNLSDRTINDASSYLDLSFVYGTSAEQVDELRKKDGSGKIWNDTFMDSRLLFMPPSVCALAVLFSRHHNYIAQNILDLNERGTFRSLQSAAKASLLSQDDEIFHRARLVNTAFFTEIILTDYLSCVLGLVRDGLTLRLDPLVPFRQYDHSVSPRGAGNAVSIEFNLLYRWHASISQKDEVWLTGVFEELGKDPKTLTPEEFAKVVREKVAPSGDPQTWTFGNLKRDSNGLFVDKDLARILNDATEQRAGAFRARGISPVMRVVEIMGILEGRKWQTCTLNEFRKFIGLRPYTSFKEWNPDPSIYPEAEKLYGHIDNLELHVGLQAEETKPPIPGSGMCAGFTISRALLGDAACLTRGDRFLTVDHTPYNLTSWGYQHCTVNTINGGGGKFPHTKDLKPPNVPNAGMLTKLLFCLLPDQCTTNSIHAYYPFLTPDFLAAIRKRPPGDDILKDADFSPTSGEVAASASPQ